MLNLRAFFTVFPACAGVSLRLYPKFVPITGIPRVCGGEPKGMPVESVQAVYSPRVRG